MEQLLVWGCLLLLAAAALFAIELFVPSGGILGLMAGVVAVAGVVVFWRYNQWWGLGSMLLVAITAPIAFNFALKVIPNTPMGRRLILSDSEEEVERKGVEAAREQQAAAAVIGATGVALTDLRPIGTALIENTRIEVLSEGGMVHAGSPVRVTAVVDNQVKVRAVRG